MPDRGRFVFLPRVRAVLVFDFIAKHALAEFDLDPHIHVLLKGQQTVHFLFRNAVLVRFKKGNTKGIGSNVETQAALSFIDPQGVIPGLVPEIMKIEICYTPDVLGLTLDEVAVVARSRHKRVWAYPIDRKKQTADVVELPLRTPDETRPVVVPRQPPLDETSDIEE